MRILVVDDDPEIVNFLKRGLIYEGYPFDRQIILSPRLLFANESGSALSSSPHYVLGVRVPLE